MEHLKLIEEVLDEALPRAGERPTALSEAMRYAVGAGGKRIRPLVCLNAAVVALEGLPGDTRFLRSLVCDLAGRKA
jgi:geranylgeranyl diphosphate synthase type II